MAEGRQRAEWDRTASLMALTANLHRDPKKRRRPFTPAEFHPFSARRRRARPVTVAQLTEEIMRIAEAEARR